MPGALLTVTEAAALLDVHPKTLYLLVSRGQSPVEPVRIGSKLRFRRVDMEAFLGEPAARGSR